MFSIVYNRIRINDKIDWNELGTETNYLDFVSLCWHTPLMALNITRKLPFNNKSDFSRSIISSENSIIFSDLGISGYFKYKQKKREKLGNSEFSGYTYLWIEPPVYFHRKVHSALSKYRHVIDSFSQVAWYIWRWTFWWLDLAGKAVVWIIAP